MINVARLASLAQILETTARTVMPHPTVQGATTQVVPISEELANTISGALREIPEQVAPPQAHQARFLQVGDQIIGLNHVTRVGQNPKDGRVNVVCGITGFVFDGDEAKAVWAFFAPQPAAPANIAMTPQTPPTIPETPITPTPVPAPDPTPAPHESALQKIEHVAEGVAQIGLEVLAQQPK